MRRIDILYSNTPNPIVRERLYALRNTLRLNASIVYIQRKNSPISLHGFEGPHTIEAFETPDTRGRILLKLVPILRMVSVCFRRKPDELYAIYPDMLLAATLYKILSLRFRLPVYYEIQDINETGYWGKIIHCLLMQAPRRIFLTADRFRDEFIFFTRSLNRRATFISNAPLLSCWRSVVTTSKVCKSDDGIICIGVVGMLREKAQLSAVEKILKDDRFSVLLAGTNLFEQELAELDKRYPNLRVFGQYDPGSLYSEIIPLLDIMWCVYPKTRNYERHIARRFMEAIALGVLPVVARHAQSMLDFEKELPFELFSIESNDAVDLNDIHRWFESNRDRVIHHKIGRFETYQKDFLEAFGE